MLPHDFSGVIVVADGLLLLLPCDFRGNRREAINVPTVEQRGAGETRWLRGGQTLNSYSHGYAPMSA